MNLPRANAVFAVRDHPHCGEPLVEADRGILEDGSNLDGELAFRMASLALPHTPGRHKRDFPRSASGAHDAILAPATVGKVVDAVIGVAKVLNRLLKCLWFVCHAHNLA